VHGAGKRVDHVERAAAAGRAGQLVGRIGGQRRVDEDEDGGIVFTAVS
jgi:hypothetical protein